MRPKEFDTMTSQELVGELLQIVGFVCVQPRKHARGTWCASPEVSLPPDQARIKELIQDYVVTTDNFLKMIMIAVKAEARIPIILMGETGCGKTSLVRVLAKILGVQFHTLCFHPGVSTDEILEFVETHSAAAEQSGLETWLFLDKINTSQNLGILQSLIVNREIPKLSRALSPKLVPLSACNTYCKKSSTASAALSVRSIAKVHFHADLVYSVDSSS